MTTAFLCAAVSAAFSFGEVNVDCPKPENWKISLTREAEADGGEVARIVCDAPDAAMPPCFTVLTQIPQMDISYKWTVNTENCRIPPNWGGTDRTDVAHGMPLSVGFNGNDQAVFSAAAGECVRPVTMRMGVKEEGDFLVTSFTYFEGAAEPIKHYETSVRFNAKRRPFADAVRSETEWIVRNAGITPCRAPKGAFDPLYSSWYNFHQDVTDSAIEAECEIASKLGMKTIIVDDGWQTDDTNRGYAFCGDWQVSKRRFPDMAAHVKRVQAMGMKYMMWYSVPFVGFNSKNYERFNGKYLYKSDGMHAAVLDPRFPEVRQFLIDIYVKALRDWNIDGFKLDFIDSFAVHGRDPALDDGYAGRDIRSVPEAVDRLMTDVHAALAAIKPDILIEFRQSYDGPSIRRFGNMLRVGDCPGDMRRNRFAIANMRLAGGSAAVHADMLEWSLDQDPKVSALNMINCMFGVIQYSVMLRDASKAQRAMIAKWIKFSQDHRDALLHGSFTPRHPELNYPIIGAESAKERIIGVYDDGRLVDIPSDVKPTFLMNASGRDTLTVRCDGKIQEVPCKSGDWVELRGADIVSDVVIYGSSPAAITAAISAQKHGRRAVIVCPETRIGGLTTGGLGQTDIGNKSAFGGLARAFYHDIAEYYRDDSHWTREKRSDYMPDGQCADSVGADTMWTFEPHAALDVLENWERKYDLFIVRGEALDRSGSGVLRNKAGRIVSIRTLSGKTFVGSVFVDATYEGDMMAAAGVSYTVGREANSKYGERNNGIERAKSVGHQLEKGVDPYVVKGDPSSGLLPYVENDVSDPDGTGDGRVQAYCFRMCLTDDPANRIPFAKPANYKALNYELLLRNLEAIESERFAKNVKTPWKVMPWINSRMPNRKTDTNNRTGFSTDFIGRNWAWPEASYEERAKILKEHLDYQRGLMWTLANDPRVPDMIRNEVARWGTCKDEFADGLGSGWQNQLYVREGRRMIGDYVMTEANCRHKAVAPRPIALGAYTMDSHNARRYVGKDGFAHNEGNIEDYETLKLGPYPIDYGAIVPKKAECPNLFVPVAISASHMAFGSIRMEPVFFALGQVAGDAAALSLNANCAVQDLDYKALRNVLLAEGQVLAAEKKSR